MDTHLRRYIRAQTKAKLVKPWLDAILGESDTVLERRVIAATSTIGTSDQNIRIQSAAKGRRMSGGLQPKLDYPGVEFGSDRNKVTKYTRQGHVVRRHTARQMPARRNAGPFYVSARKMIPRLASLWVQTIVHTVADVFEGRIR